MKQYNFLIKQLALTDFKLRYNASILGYLWSLLNPLLQFAVLFLVFSVFLRFEVPSYKLYLLLGIITWGFLVESTNNAMNSVLEKASLIRKLNFPRQIIIIASNMTSSISLIINFLVFCLFLFFSKVKLTFIAFFLPFYLFWLLLLISGFSFLLCALYVRFRDVKHLWGILLQLGFWLTPIVYPMSLVPQKVRFLFKINPMYGVIHNLREVTVYGRVPELSSTIITITLSIIIFFIGYFVFRKMSDSFAEYI